MNSLRYAMTIAGKDLRLYCRDRAGMALGFLLPAALVLVFGFVFKLGFGGEGGFSRAILWVTDQDNTQKSRQFIQGLRGTDLLSVRPREGDAEKTPDQLRQMVEDGEAHHALVVNVGFEATLQNGEVPRLTLFRDPGRSLESQLVSIGLFQGFLSGAGVEVAPIMTARAMEAMGLPSSYLERSLAISHQFSSAVELLFTEAIVEDEPEAEDEAASPSSQSPATPESDVGEMGFADILARVVPVEEVNISPPERPKQLSFMLSQSVAGIAVMMLMFGLVACSTLLLQEREGGTMQRLLLSPASRSSLLWGKFIFVAIIGMGQLAVMFLVGQFVFDVGLFRDPVTLVVNSLVLVFTITSFGLLIAVAAHTIKQAEGLSTIIILIMSALGGAWVPIQMFELPQFAEVICRSTITWWAMSSWQGMLWYGKSFTDPSMLLDLGVLMAFGLVATALSFFLFKRRYVNT